MASRLVPRLNTLPNLRPIRRLSSDAGDGDGAARPPFPFSDIRDRLRSGPSPPRRVPDLPSSPFPPDPAAAGGEAGASRPQSPFSDIKDRLRSAPAPGPPPRLPDLPPPPPPSSPSLDDIRKNLAEFRSKTPRPPSASAPPTLSFQQLFQNNLLNNNNNSNNPPDPAAPPPHTLSFDSIRDSLRKLQPGAPPAASQFPGSRNLRPPPAPAPSSDTLPGSIFDKKDDGPKAPRTEFLRMYSYDELGEKLRQLRPQGETAAGGQFSLAELNDRLVKLRELEEKEADSRMGGVSFRDLRDSLVRLKYNDAEKKATSEVNKLSILTNLSGLPTPAFMLKDPQEELFERYNHPDHMSSEEKMKLELKKVRDEFKMSESDCGSTRVQVAQLTTKIKHLSSVLHKKDKHSRKGLEEMVQRRKKLLKYLRRTDWDSYCFTLSKLGLRDIPEYKAPDYKTQTQTQTKTKTKKKKKTKAKA